MSQCRKERESSPISKYLLVFITGLILLSFSMRASAQDDARKTPPPPPPHPKLKEMVDKIKKFNPFKKHKDDAATENTTASTANDKKADPTPPPPDPKPQPSVVKPASTTGTTHKSTKKKKTTKPSTAPKSGAPPII